MDLKAGVRLQDLQDGALIAGTADGEDVVLVRRGDSLFAVGAHCTHYHGPLADGLIVGDTVRCPWPHACFSLSTGAALRAPAFDPLSRWRVDRVGDTVYVREKLDQPVENRRKPSERSGATPASIVIVGGGPAGTAGRGVIPPHGCDR